MKENFGAKTLIGPKQNEESEKGKKDTQTHRFVPTLPRLG